MGRDSIAGGRSPRIAQIIRDDTYGQLRHAQNLVSMPGIENVFVGPAAAERALPALPFVASNLGRRPTPNTAREARHLASKLKLYDVDAIHAHSVATLVPGLLIARLLRVPLVHSPHALPVQGLSGSWPEVQVAKGLVRLAALSGAAFVSVSEGERMQLNKLVRGRPSYMVLNPVPGRYLAQGHVAREPFTVVALSRFWPQKAPLLLVDSFARAAKMEPRARLLWAGDGPELEECRRRATELGVAHHVEFLGKIADPLPLLQRASVFLSTSSFEAMPYSVLEAMAAGAAVVATDIPAHREIDGGTEALRLCDATVEAISEALADVLGNGAVREELRGRAHALARQRHSLHAFSKGMEQVYRELLNQPPARVHEDAGLRKAA